MDIMLRGPDLNWASDPGFPAAGAGAVRAQRVPACRTRPATTQGWTKTVQLMEFARYQRRAFVKIRDGDYEIIFASPKFSESTRGPT